MKLVGIFTLLLLITNINAFAQRTYKPTERVFNRASDYVNGFFDGKAPNKATVWVIGDLRDNINDVINDADNTPVRYRNWKLDNRKLWVLDCVACTMPITAGVVVEDGKILDISVLSYRESRGHEVQSRAHRAQYFGATITPKKKLDLPINGISSSTLSVNSMKRMARIALLLHNHVTSDD